MVEKHKLIEKGAYWYVFVPAIGINLQSVRVEQLGLEKFVDGVPVFRVLRGPEHNRFSTVGISLNDSDYTNLFYLEDEIQAKKLWVREYFKRFKEINSIDVPDFIELYKQFQKENPECLI